MSIAQKMHAKPSIEKDTETNLLVAQGTHLGSKIALFQLQYENNLQSSVFIYPDTYNLNPAIIRRLDERFGQVEKSLILREFTNFSVEDLEMHFLRDIKPMIPFISHQYETPTQIRINEHSFHYAAADYINGVISDMKGK